MLATDFDIVLDSRSTRFMFIIEHSEIQLSRGWTNILCRHLHFAVLQENGRSSATSHPPFFAIPLDVVCLCLSELWTVKNDNSFAAAKYGTPKVKGKFRANLNETYINNTSFSNLISCPVNLGSETLRALSRLRRVRIRLPDVPPYLPYFQSSI